MILFVPNSQTHRQSFFLSLLVHFCFSNCPLRRSLKTRWKSWSRWSPCWSSTRLTLPSYPSSKRKSGTCLQCWQASRRSSGPMTTMSSISESCVWTAGFVAAWANWVSCHCIHLVLVNKKSWVLKRTVHWKKLKFHPFTTHLLCRCGVWWHFIVQITILEFHR